MLTEEKDRPLISVVMSIYNETPDQLRRSIGSILDQTFSDFEFLIVNDNPGNQILEAVLYGYSDERIRLIKNEKNIGLANSLNKAIEESEGRYIARMDADDKAGKERLKLQLRFLEKNSLDLVGCFINIADENGRIYGKKSYPIKDQDIRRLLRFENVMAHPTWFVKKDVYKKVGLYRNIPYCEDYDFLLRALKKSVHFGNVPQFLFDYTKRGNSITESSGSKHFYNSLILQEHYDVLETFDEKAFQDYVDSKAYEHFLRRIKGYQDDMATIRGSNQPLRKAGSFIKLLFNRYFYIFAYRKIRKGRIDHPGLEK